MAQHELASNLKSAIDQYSKSLSVNQRIGEDFSLLKTAVNAVCNFLNKKKRTMDEVRAKAIASGRCGRKRKPFDIDAVLKMREQGISHAEIGEKLGCHESTVYAKLKEYSDSLETAEPAKPARKRAK